MLSTWLNNRGIIEEAISQEVVISQCKRQRPGQFEDAEEALLHWFQLWKDTVLKSILKCYKPEDIL